jgi:pyridoxamine 5'-phosphate oxidase
MTETPADPIARFKTLLKRAEDTDRAIIPEPTAMALATSSPEGRPSLRMVLLKNVDDSGFVFYTNYESRKGKELLGNPYAALCFHWAPLEVQVRIEGAVKKVHASEADDYFRSRPRGSQIGAWASKQSMPLASDDELLQRVAELEKEYEGKEIPRPPFWSGFRVEPWVIEFWRNRPSRLHLRERYARAGSEWRFEQLNP